MGEDLIGQLSKEEILAKGFTERDKWYAYKLSDNDFIAIDDRKKKEKGRLVWGYKAGKPMNTEEVKNIISDIFRKKEPPEEEAEELDREIAEEFGEEAEAEVMEEVEKTPEVVEEKTDAEILKEMDRNMGHSPVERIAWKEISPDFLKTQREQLKEKKFTAVKISDTHYRVGTGTEIYRDVEIDPSTGDVISCDCEKWFFKHSPINPCIHMIFVHDLLLEQVREKAEKETVVIPKGGNREKMGMEKRKVEEKAISKAKPKEGQSLVKRKIGLKMLEAIGGYYQVRGRNGKMKEVPDAWLAQQFSNEAGASVRIVVAEQTHEHALAVVEAELGSITVQDAVCHHFDTVKDKMILDIIKEYARENKRVVSGYDAEGRPILDEQARLRVFDRFVRFKDFSLRDAISKASRRAILKILNSEWREKEEIEAEKKEVEAVNAGE